MLLSRIGFFAIIEKIEKKKTQMSRDLIFFGKKAGVVIEKKDFLSKKVSSASSLSLEDRGSYSDIT